MKYPRQVTLLVSGLFVLAAIAACGGGGEARLVGEDGSAIDVTTTTADAPATGTATEAPSADVSPTAVPPEGTATPSATETPTSDATGTATPATIPATTPGGTDLDEYEGVPYSTSDVRAAVESAGRAFLPAERDATCSGTSVPGFVFWAPDADGSDTGPNWALWIYPDTAAREAEWSLEGGRLEPQVDGCELATGFNYFNANAVLAFVTWTGPGVDSPFDPSRSPGEDAAKDAFITMGAGSN